MQVKINIYDKGALQEGIRKEVFQMKGKAG